MAEEQRDGIKCVVQRCNTARICVDEADLMQEIGRGIIIYVSFGLDCGDGDVEKAAQALVNLPLATTTEWGDGTKPRSVVSILQEEQDHGIMVIPQACMTAKMKGKSIKYHRQLEKSVGLRMYSLFLAHIEVAVFEGLMSQMFRNQTCYDSFVQSYGKDFKPEFDTFQSFDKRGVPTTSSDGEPLSKQLRKYFDNMYKHFLKLGRDQLQSRAEAWISYHKKHSKHLDDIECSENLEQVDQPPPLHPYPFKLVSGTFGNRQAVNINSQCGPSTHIFNF